jgi:hypothetical protein
MTNFGQQFESFSRAIDIVTDDVRSTILRMIQDKLDTCLNIKFITLHVATTVDQAEGLRTSEWFIGGSQLGTAISLLRGDGKYRSQVALSFLLNKILWIVCEGKKPLDSGAPLMDLASMSDANTIPAYIPRADSLSKTSVIIPLSKQFGSKPYAVINFESTRYLEHNQGIEREMRRIAESISRLYIRYENHSKSLDDTQDEIDRLRKIESYMRTSKPSLFFAFSGKACSDVLNVVNEVLGDLKYDAVDLRRWDQDQQLGSIHNHIYENVKQCHYAVCYLSEPDPANSGYRDNANVLIEIGMLWFRSEDLSNVILIRESSDNGSKPPFDIANKRMLKVTRDQASGGLDTTAFKRQFQKMLDKMLEAE